MERQDGVEFAAKIDSLATNGLEGVSNSLAYRAHEVEIHFHHYTRVFGLAAVPAGETHRADTITTSPNPFQIDAGNDDWGSWVQIFGSTDTPSGWVKWDASLISIVAAERANAVYLLQMAAGATGAAGLAAGTYSDNVFTPQSVNGRPAAINYAFRRQDATTKLWMRTWCRGQNTATLDFYVKLHGYAG
jgi:hypothetical protein